MTTQSPDEKAYQIVKDFKEFKCETSLRASIALAIAQERASKPTFVLPDHEAIKKEALKRNYSYGTKPYMAFILGGQFACEQTTRLNAPTVCEEKCDEK